MHDPAFHSDTESLTEGRDPAAELRFNVRVFSTASGDLLRLELDRFSSLDSDAETTHSQWRERSPLTAAKIDGVDAALFDRVIAAAKSAGALVLPNHPVTGQPAEISLLLGGREVEIASVARFLTESQKDHGSHETAGHGAGTCLLHALKSTTQPPPESLDLRSGVLRLDRPLVMGVLNVTPDSFSDGGRYKSVDDAVDHAHAMVSQGADLIDIGGESTRPGSSTVSVSEEIDRVGPVIERLARDLPVPLSIDTSKAPVARISVDLGAQIVNDVTALRGDPEMAATVASLRCGLILMHMRGEPRTMQADPQYRDLIGDLVRELRESVQRAVEAGVHRRAISIDPGFGFGKSITHNLEILARLGEFKCLGLPLVIGTSRKSTLGHLTGRLPDERMAATAATVALAIREGVQIVRVHDVAQMRDVAIVAHAVRRSVDNRNPELVR